MRRFRPVADRRAIDRQSVIADRMNRRDVPSLLSVFDLRPTRPAAIDRAGGTDTFNSRTVLPVSMRWRRAVGGLAIAVVVVALFVYSVGWNEVVANVRTAHPIALTLAVVAGLVMLALRGLLLRQLLEPVSGAPAASRSDRRSSRDTSPGAPSRGSVDGNADHGVSALGELRLGVRGQPRGRRGHGRVQRPRKLDRRRVRIRRVRGDDRHDGEPSHPERRNRGRWWTCRRWRDRRRLPSGCRTNRFPSHRADPRGGDRPRSQTRGRTRNAHRSDRGLFATLETIQASHRTLAVAFGITTVGWVFNALPLYFSLLALGVDVPFALVLVCAPLASFGGLFPSGWKRRHRSRPREPARRDCGRLGWRRNRSGDPLPTDDVLDTPRDRRLWGRRCVRRGTQRV